MDILHFILGIILVALLIWLLLLKRDIRGMGKKLKQIVENDENALLDKEPLDDAAAGLVESVNVVLESKQHGFREKKQATELLKTTIVKIANNQKAQINRALSNLETIYSADVDIDTQEMNLQMINEQLSDMIVYSDRLIEYGNVIDGSITMNIIQNNICNVLRDKVNDFSPMFENREINVDGEIPDDPIMCLCDDVVLRDVMDYIFNYICVNGDETLNIGVSGGVTTIEYKDRNMLSNTDIANMFDYTRDVEVSKSGKSTSLGLAIAKGLIDLMKGRIVAESDGDLVVIRMTLPLIASQASNPGKVEDFRVKPQ